MVSSSMYLKISTVALTAGAGRGVLLTPDLKVLTNVLHDVLIPNSPLYLIDLKNTCGFSFSNVKFKALCIYCHLGFRLLVEEKRTDLKHRNHSRLWALFIMPFFLKD